MMRKLTLLVATVLTFQFTFAQNKSQLAFEHVINEGFSTAPDFVVLTIKNLNNGQTKEITSSVLFVYEAFKNEHNEADYNTIGNYLLSNSQTRIFELRNNDALKMLNFDSYELKYADEIEEIFKHESLVDSLSKITVHAEKNLDKFYEYSDHREEMIKEIKDSIGATRSLTAEELTMLEDLKDQYYDYHYNEYARVSEQGKQLMKIWNDKISPFKRDYKKHTDELERLEQKFFRNHYAKYGISFCHLAFKYGVVFYSNCENGMLEFKQVIE